MSQPHGAKPLPSWIVPIGNLAMRSAALGARFALTLYIARALGYEALGIFGLLAGVAGVLPALVGFGISYHVNREILLVDPAQAHVLLRDRLAASILLALLLGAVGGALLAAGFVPALPGWPIAAAIVALELIAFDLHIGMLHLGRPIAANFLLFVRSASWVVPVIALGVAVPALRTLDALLVGWLAALLINFALIPFIFREVRWAALVRAPVAWRRMRDHALRTPLIYANDLAMVGQTYLDRFIVARMLGATATGVYTLFFSLTHGVYMLVASAVTQMSTPRLAAVRDDIRAFHRVMLADGARATAYAVAMAAAASFATLLLLPAVGYTNFLGHGWFFGLMLAAAVLKPVADLGHAGLYALGADRALALVNLVGTALSVPVAVTLIGWCGLVGVGWSALLLQIGLIATRLLLIRRHFRNQRPGTSR